MQNFGKSFLHFREISYFYKMLHVVEEGLISGSLPDNQGGFTCMSTIPEVKSLWPCIVAVQPSCARPGRKPQS